MLPRKKESLSEATLEVVQGSFFYTCGGNVNWVDSAMQTWTGEAYFQYWATDVTSAASVYLYRAGKGTKNWSLSYPYSQGSPWCHLDNLEKKALNLYAKE